MVGKGLRGGGRKRVKRGGGRKKVKRGVIGKGLGGGW